MSIILLGCATTKEKKNVCIKHIQKNMNNANNTLLLNMLIKVRNTVGETVMQYSCCQRLLQRCMAPALSD